MPGARGSKPRRRRSAPTLFLRPAPISCRFRGWRGVWPRGGPLTPWICTTRPLACRAFSLPMTWVALAYRTDDTLGGWISVRKVHRQMPDVSQEVADRGTAVIERHLAAYGVSRA